MPAATHSWERREVVKSALPFALSGLTQVPGMGWYRLGHWTHWNGKGRLRRSCAGQDRWEEPGGVRMEKQWSWQTKPGA